MEFCRANTLDEALESLREWGTSGRVLAGGTDLMLQQRQGETAPGALIHIGGVDALSTISTGVRTTIGPLVTHRTLATDPDLAERHPALAEAAAMVGGWQTQTVGTLGGNICNASPAADTVPPILVAAAHVTLMSTEGERRLALDEFLVGRRQSALRPGELLTSIDLEPVTPGTREVYVKLGRRGAMDVALVGLAVRLVLEDDGSVSAARIATCSVGPTPRRVPEAEHALVGSRLEADELSAAGAALIAASSPIDDARATASYRRRVLPGLLERAVTRCSSAARP